MPRVLSWEQSYRARQHPLRRVPAGPIPVVERIDQLRALRCRDSCYDVRHVQVHRMRRRILREPVRWHALPGVLCWQGDRIATAQCSQPPRTPVIDARVSVCETPVLAASRLTPACVPNAAVSEREHPGRPLRAVRRGHRGALHECHEMRSLPGGLLRRAGRRFAAMPAVCAWLVPHAQHVGHPVRTLSQRIRHICRRYASTHPTTHRPTPTPPYPRETHTTGAPART